MRPIRRLLSISLIFLVVLSLFLQCKDEFPKLVLISTGDIKHINAVTVEASGRISDIGEGIKKHGFCWSTESTPTINDFTTDLGPKKESGSFSATLEDLDPNEGYYYRAYASDGSTNFYGSEKSFTTQNYTIPTVQTSVAYDITPTSATISGTITDLGNGVAVVSQHGHCWSTGLNPTIADFKTELGQTTSTGDFISGLTGLDDSTFYYIRAYATNVRGTAYGSLKSFWTPGYFPQVADDEIETLSATSVQISTNLIYLGPDGLVTNHGHCWADHDNPTLSDNVNDLGSTSTTGYFQSIVTDLISGTLYYWRSYVTNSYGTYYGEIFPFVAGDPANYFINDPNLVGYFPFLGTAEDLSSLELDGTIDGATFTTDRNDIANSALLFDGVDDYVNCSADNRNITNKLTISAWIQTTASVGGRIVNKYDWSNGVVLHSTDAGYLHMSGRDGSSYYYITSSYIADGDWHHIIGTVDINTWQVWLDGVLDGSLVTSTSTPSLVSVDPWTIGNTTRHGTGVPGAFFTGKIDDVLIFNRVLTEEEINILSTGKK